MFYIFPLCTQTALTFFVFGFGSSDFYTVRITSGWNAQKWYPCVYFRNRGGYPPPFWIHSGKVGFSKRSTFQKNGTLPICPQSPKSPEINESPICTLPTKKKLEIQILKTKKVTAGRTWHFRDISSDIVQIQGFLLRASRGGSCAMAAPATSQIDS